MAMKELQVQSYAVELNGEMLNLTSMWKAAGSKANRRPSDWQNTDAGSQFIEHIALVVNGGLKPLFKTTKGKTGATWAHWQIGLAYASYLSPEFAAEVNQAYRQLKAEEADPQLSVNKAIARWRKLGKSDEWIAARTNGILARNTLTPVLASHGISGPDGYARCTDATYTPLFGGSASVIRDKRELPAKANVREHMSRLELAAIELAEMLASQKIEDERLYGDGELQSACLIASRSVAKAVVTCKSEPVLKSAF